MMLFRVSSPAGAEYVPFILEQMGYDFGIYNLAPHSPSVVYLMDSTYDRRDVFAKLLRFAPLTFAETESVYTCCEIECDAEDVSHLIQIFYSVAKNIDDELQSRAQSIYHAETGFEILSLVPLAGLAFIRFPETRYACAFRDATKLIQTKQAEGMPISFILTLV